MFDLVVFLISHKFLCVEILFFHFPFYLQKNFLSSLTYLLTGINWCPKKFCIYEGGGGGREERKEMEGIDGILVLYRL